MAARVCPLPVHTPAPPRRCRHPPCSCRQPAGSPRACIGATLMEPLQPYDVALCMLLRSFLCPVDDVDPPPHSPLHAAFGEALLAEVRRCDTVACPSLVQLLRHIQVRDIQGSWRRLGRRCRHAIGRRGGEICRWFRPLLARCCPAAPQLPPVPCLPGRSTCAPAATC